MRFRLPEPTWAPGRGCTTVIGDALHPTQPTLAQGGCMAIVRKPPPCPGRIQERLEASTGL